MQLSHDELRRYARQLILPEVGREGQEKLRSASVLCVGAGGLGSPTATYLAAAGIGRLGIVESDVVDASNLHRQILHRTEDIGRPKAESARDALLALNPHMTVELHGERLTSRNALEVLGDYMVVADGSDNFPTRYLVNDACVRLHKTNIYGAVLRFEGQASVFAPDQGGPCYRCLYPEPPPPGHAPSCAEAGVLGVVPGIIGCVQATETLKHILGSGDPLIGRLLLFDALRMVFRELKVRRDPGCAVCGEHPTLKNLTDLEIPCPALPTSNQVSDEGTVVEEVDVRAMQNALQSPSQGIEVLDVREPHERALTSVPGTRSIPLSTLPQAAKNLDPGREYYLHCRSGQRSLRAAALLAKQGFAKVRSVRGGLQAWVAEVDPELPLV